MRTSTEFFGFYQDPFKRTPDVDFYYPTQMHLEALDTLSYLIHSDEPFAVLTGEPGTGKTITIKKFINELPENIVSAYILFPNLTPEELFMAILEDFDIHVDKTLTKNALFAKLRDFLIDIGSQGKKAVIIIDEAQNLPNETLEELRLLSNLETEKDKLLKIILAGQPELDTKLDDESLRQLKQRVTLYVKLYNIKDEDIKDYIYSHLDKAGKGRISIHNDVIRKIAKITKGNPRLINTLMDRTISAAFLDESHTITDEHLRNAIVSINHVIAAGRKRTGIKRKPLVAVAVIGVLAVLVGYLGVDKILQNSQDEKTVYTASNNLPENNNQQTADTVEVQDNPVIISNVDNRQEVAQYESSSTAQPQPQPQPQEPVNIPQVQQNNVPASPQAVAERPVVREQAPVAERPVVREQTPVVERPVIREQAPVVEPPVVREQAPVAERPVVREQAPVVEPPVVREQVPVVEPPVVREQPPVTESPLIAEQSIPEPVINEPIINEPVAEVPQQPIVQEKDVYILAKSLNVRATPSLEAERVGAAIMGQKFEYIQENDEWVEIRLSPVMTGWVFKRYVSISNR